MTKSTLLINNIMVADASTDIPTQQPQALVDNNNIECIRPQV